MTKNLIIFNFLSYFLQQSVCFLCLLISFLCVGWWCWKGFRWQQKIASLSMFSQYTFFSWCNFISSSFTLLLNEKFFISTDWGGCRWCFSLKRHTQKNSFFIFVENVIIIFPLNKIFLFLRATTTIRKSWWWGYHHSFISTNGRLENHQNNIF